MNSGRLLGFISAPVISAFTSAVSIQVATSQVKGLLGLKVHIIRKLQKELLNNYHYQDMPIWAKTCWFAQLHKKTTETTRVFKAALLLQIPFVCVAI